jgi:hypothetical protein
MGDTQSGSGYSIQDIIGALSRMAGGGQPPAPRVEPPMNAPGRAAGLKAVEGATTGRQEPTVSGETARAAGLSAVDKEMDAANTEAWKSKMAGRKADRARAGSEGKAAVADATSPSRVRDMMTELSQRPGWTPEESQAWARALGQVGVANALHMPNNPPGFSPPANTQRPTTVTRGPNAHLLTPEQEASVQNIMRQNQGAAEGDEIHHDMTLVDEFLARGHPDYQPVPEGDPRLPVVPPGQTFGPHPVTTPDMAAGQIVPSPYAPSGMRAAHYGKDAVERELDKEPD